MIDIFFTTITVNLLELSLTPYLEHFTGWRVIASL